MSTEVVMPQMGESLSEGTVTKWYKKVGESVVRDEPLFDITTDKVDTEVPAPADGVLQEILVPEGETVAVGTVVARLGAGLGRRERPAPSENSQQVESARGATPSPGPTPPQASDSAGGHFKSPHEPTTFIRKPSPPHHPPSQPPGPSAGKAGREHYLSPAVVSLAAEHRLPMPELTQIHGTGADGRITKKDVQRYIEERKRRGPLPPTPPIPVSYPPPAYSPPGYHWTPPPYSPYAAGSPSAYPAPTSPPPADAMVPAPASAPVPAAPGPTSPEVPQQYLYKPEPEDTLVPMSVMRKQIAEHMIWSQQISAQVTSFTECDMYRIMRYRDEKRDAFAAAEGVPLTSLPFVAEATVKALRQFPIFNASVLEDQIVMRKHVHLGIAVALEEGLLVPVVRNAEEMNFVGLARAIHDLAERARNKQLSPEEVHGASFTITNPGMFGGLTGTPMIPQPQVAILGLGAMQKKPVVIEDAIAIRPIMVLALTFDHRIIDGATGFQFIERVRANLEHFQLA